MNLIKKYGLFIYWLVLLLDCLLIFTQDFSYRWYTKLLLVPILVVYVILHERKHHHFALRITYFSAMAAAWLSDALLLVDTNSYFSASVWASAAMHFCYMFFFLRLKPLNLKVPEQTVTALLIFIVINFFLIKFVQNDVKMSVLPLWLYTVLAGLAIAFCANVLNSSVRKRLALNNFLPAMVLFFFSDAFMLVNKFKFQENFLDIVAMLSYGYAQYTMAIGSRKVLKS